MKTQVIGVLLVVTLFRLIGLILGCWYGPFIYIVIPLGVLYLSLDILTVFMVYASDIYEWEVGEKVSKWAWIGCNIVALIGLFVAFIFYLVDLGFWGMTYYPIHICLFILIIFLWVAIVMAIVLILKSFKAQHDYTERRGRKAKNQDYEGLSNPKHDPVLTY